MCTSIIYILKRTTWYSFNQKEIFVVKNSASKQVFKITFSEWVKATAVFSRV